LDSSLNIYQKISNTNYAKRNFIRHFKAKLLHFFLRLLRCIFFAPDSYRDLRLWIST
jgi:hypothetical protein